MKSLAVTSMITILVYLPRHRAHRGFLSKLSLSASSASRSSTGSLSPELVEERGEPAKSFVSTQITVFAPKLLGGGMQGKPGPPTGRIAAHALQRQRPGFLPANPILASFQCGANRGHDCVGNVGVRINSEAPEI